MDHSKDITYAVPKLGTLEKAQDAVGGMMRQAQYSKSKKTLVTEDELRRVWNWIKEGRNA